jgi:hypothetical protein
MTTATFTEKQQQAIEAMEGARGEGVALSKYAKAHGLAIRELYDAIACLRRKGLLSKPTRKANNKFVSLRAVAATDLAGGVHGGGCGCCDLTAGSNGYTCIERPLT